ncbi:F0F1 ATP synthase subunit A [Mycoplasma hafezii]|uniref:F0F1 ATP synthase subunit A n=1 Tax=Mycoplasma hafezii TaxID=525886 RepID=UPI003CF1F11B
MDQIIENFSNWAHPQLLSLIVSVLIVFIMSLTAFFKIKKVKPNQAPTGIAYVAEAYVGMIDSQFDEAVGDKILQKSRVYILTLGTFLLVGNGVAIIGLEPIVTSYTIPFTLALSSWLGIFTCGVIYRRWKYYKNFINPFDWPGKFSPLISLSFRIYGNVIGGSAVIFLIYSMLANIGSPLPSAHGASAWVFIGPIFTPVLHFYFDVFGSTLQAYIFTLLTVIYWVVEAGDPVENNSEKKTTHKNKKTRIGLKPQEETIY